MVIVCIVVRAYWVHVPSLKSLGAKTHSCPLVPMPCMQNTLYFEGVLHILTVGRAVIGVKWSQNLDPQRLWPWTVPF